MNGFHGLIFCQFSGVCRFNGLQTSHIHYYDSITNIPSRL